MHFNMHGIGNVVYLLLCPHRQLLVGKQMGGCAVVSEKENGCWWWWVFFSLSLIHSLALIQPPCFMVNAWMQQLLLLCITLWRDGCSGSAPVFNCAGRWVLVWLRWLLLFAKGVFACSFSAANWSGYFSPSLCTPVGIVDWRGDIVSALLTIVTTGKPGLLFSDFYLWLLKGTCAIIKGACANISCYPTI